jgi:hypothetical protein
MRNGYWLLYHMLLEMDLSETSSLTGFLGKTEQNGMKESGGDFVKSPKQIFHEAMRAVDDRCMNLLGRSESECPRVQKASLAPVFPLKMPLLFLFRLVGKNHDPGRMRSGVDQFQLHLALDVLKERLSTP